MASKLKSLRDMIPGELSNARVVCFSPVPSKKDSLRRIDRVIDYFGESTDARASAESLRDGIRIPTVDDDEN